MMSRGKYTFWTSVAVLTMLVDAWLTPCEKSVHGRSPTYEKIGYGRPSDPTPASRPKKIVKTTMLRSGWRIAQAAPSAVCL